MGLSQERYLDLHKKFLDTRHLGRGLRCSIIDYCDYEDKEDRPYQGLRMRVVQDTATGLNELLNWTNHFALVVDDFVTRARILDEIEDEDERFSALFEIISPFSFFALSFPSAIRSKLVFVCARMIRDSFNVQAKGRPLSDHVLNEKMLKSLIEEIADPLLRERVEFFIKTLARIDGKAFREVTSNYRNRANHGIAPNIEVGQRMAFSPITGRGVEGFTFGVECALKLRTMIEPLAEQHRNCISSVNTFLPVVVSFRELWRTPRV